MAVSLTVHDAYGSPVSGLTAKNFAVLEDGKVVPEGESRLRVVNAGEDVLRHTLVLVDMGEDVVGEDGGAQWSYLVSDLVAELESHQKVAVYAFGSTSNGIQRIRPFINSDQGRKGLFTLLSVRTDGERQDFYSVMGEAVRVLQRQLRKAKVPDEFGTLVVLSAGGDESNRVQRDDLVQQIDGTGLAVYAVAIGDERDAGVLSQLARAGYIRVDQLSQAKAAMADVARRMTEWSNSHYVVSYCSPQREGIHQSALRVRHQEQEQELEFPIDTTGFRGGCRGRVLPNLVPASADRGATAGPERGKRKAAQRTDKQAGKQSAGRGTGRGRS